jgi:5'-3' exonuclease
MGVEPHQVVDYLALAGDAADNVPGLKGVGGATAGKMLTAYGSLANIQGMHKNGEFDHLFVPKTKARPVKGVTTVRLRSLCEDLAKADGEGAGYSAGLGEAAGYKDSVVYLSRELVTLKRVPDLCVVSSFLYPGIGTALKEGSDFHDFEFPKLVTKFNKHL